MTFLFLCREDPPEDRIDANCRKHARRYPRCIHFNRGCAARKFIVLSGVTAHRGERSGCLGVDANFAGSNRRVGTIADVISQQDQAVGIFEL